MKQAAAVVSFLAFVPGVLLAQNKQANWPHWRGPLATGVAPAGDPPIKWDDKTNIKWKTPLPGKGSSTPVVWGDKIFVLAAVDTGKKAAAKDIPKPDPNFPKKTKPPTTYYQFIVMCVDRNTGKVLWKKVATEAVPHEGKHPSHSYAAFSPVTDGKRLYASFGSRGVFCYDLEGKLLWERHFPRMETRRGWGEGSTPAVHDDTLVLTWDHEGPSFIVALDAATGKTKWKVDRDEVTTWATPLIVEHKGKTQVIVNATGRVRSYDLDTGKVIWSCGGQTVNAIPCPVAFEDKVICMSGYRGNAALAIPLDSKGDVTGKAAWKHDKGTPYVPSPVLVDGKLYFTQGNLGLLTCLDARTGKVLIDRQRLPGLAGVYGSPTAVGDRIYIPGRDGTCVVLQRKGDKVEVIASNRLDEGIDSSPVIVGKQLFLRGVNNLYCIEE